MSKRKCGRCGKDPAEGYASVWTKATGEIFYCHGDDDESPTCYEQPQHTPLSFDARAFSAGINPGDMLVISLNDATHKVVRPES